MKTIPWLAWGTLCIAACLGTQQLVANIEPPTLDPPVTVKPAVDDPTVPPPIKGKKIPEAPVKLGIDLPDEPLVLPAKKGNKDSKVVQGIKDAKEPLEQEPGKKRGPGESSRRTALAEPREPAELPAGEVVNKSSEQNVVLEWIGPSMIKVGQPFAYEMVIRNLGNDTVGAVIVRDKLTEGMRVMKVEPNGAPEDGGYVWMLGELAPHQERRIRVQVMAEKRGDVACRATVTTTTLAVAKFKVSEPQLVVKQVCPENVMVGDPVTCTITVSNPGDGPADNVVLRSKLTDGLLHDKGSEFSYDLGTLAAGETRNVHLVLTTTKGGAQQIMTHATADGGLEVDAEVKTMVTEPRIAIALNGPKLRYLDRAATYNVVVTNPGSAPANNIKATAMIPPGFKFVECSQGGRYDGGTRTVSWFVGTVKNGDKAELAYKCVAATPGQHRHVVTALGQRGLKFDAETTTAVEGISALLLEVVDVDDPVEVGSDTSYEIRVTNQGSREATNVEIHALVPKQMELKGGQGPTTYKIEGQEIIFAKLPKLAPRADAVYRVFIKAAAVGDVRFRAKLTSDSLSAPVIEEESTKIYQD